MIMIAGWKPAVRKGMNSGYECRQKERTLGEEQH
jgi:hypothetical protein